MPGYSLRSSLMRSGETASPSRRPQRAVNMFEAAASLLTPGTRRCPHLGCALKWNPVERSWDCPCHGSRYDIRGHILNTPASQPLAAGPDVLRASDEGGAE